MTSSSSSLSLSRFSFGEDVQALAPDDSNRLAREQPKQPQPATTIRDLPDEIVELVCDDMCLDVDAQSLRLALRVPVALFRACSCVRRFYDADSDDNTYGEYDRLRAALAAGHWRCAAHQASVFVVTRRLRIEENGDRVYMLLPQQLGHLVCVLISAGARTANVDAQTVLLECLLGATGRAGVRLRFEYESPLDVCTVKRILSFVYSLGPYAARENHVRLLCAASPHKACLPHVSHVCIAMRYGALAVTAPDAADVLSSMKARMLRLCHAQTIDDALACPQVLRWLRIAIEMPIATTFGQQRLFTAVRKVFEVVVLAIVRARDDGLFWRLWSVVKPISMAMGAPLTFSLTTHVHIEKARMLAVLQKRYDVFVALLQTPCFLPHMDDTLAFLLTHIFPEHVEDRFLPHFHAIRGSALTPLQAIFLAAERHDFSHIASVPADILPKYMRSVTSLSYILGNLGDETSPACIEPLPTYAPAVRKLLRLYVEIRYQLTPIGTGFVSAASLDTRTWATYQECLVAAGGRLSLYCGTNNYYRHESLVLRFFREQRQKNIATTTRRGVRYRTLASVYDTYRRMFVGYGSSELCEDLYAFLRHRSAFHMLPPLDRQFVGNVCQELGHADDLLRILFSAYRATVVTADAMYAAETLHRALVVTDTRVPRWVDFVHMLRVELKRTDMADAVVMHMLVSGVDKEIGVFVRHVGLRTCIRAAMRRLANLVHS